MTITVQDKLQCAVRELGYRNHVYPRRVAEKKMSQLQATREIKLMEAIVEDYRRSARDGEPELFNGDDAA